MKDNPLLGQTPAQQIAVLQAENERLTADLAECFRLSGADPDGNEDWRLAPRAVEEVRRMRDDLDIAEQDYQALLEAEAELRDYKREG
jgi:hypothetical protein